MKQVFFKLSNGIEIPALGFGTFEIEDNNLVAELVVEALRLGYRHIDTASYYGNEEGVGRGIKESGVARKNIFVVSKLWNSFQGYDSTLREFDKSLQKLQTDYMDLYLIHWPKGELSKQSWKAFEKIYREGRVKSIGVSNFHIHHLEDLMASCEIKPMVDQVELHPYLTQEPLRIFCKKHHIQLEAWSPLMRGKFTQIPLLHELADKYGRTPAQIILRWDIQSEAVTIPRSVHPERIKENMQLFDFKITSEDMNRISALNKDQRIGPDPDNFNF